MRRHPRAARRAVVRDLVERRDLTQLLSLMRDDAGTVNWILALAFDLDDRVRWRAIEALGVWARAMAAGDLEKIRTVIRRVLWLMNDESGGIAWHGPEIIAEMLAAAPALMDEYARIVASFIGQSPFEAGTAWAIARLAEVAPEAFADSIDELTRSTRSSDSMVRGYGLLALSMIGASEARRLATALLSDSGEVVVFERTSGVPVKTAVAALARRVLDSEFPT